MYAAALGCRVVAFEPGNPMFYYLQMSTMLNDFSQVKMYQKVVDRTEGRKTMNIAANWGFSSVSANTSATDSVPAVTLDDQFKEDILLLKIDVEGYEDNVLNGAKQLIKNYNVENIICETKKNRDVNAKIDFINQSRGSYKIFTYTENYYPASLESIQKKGWEIYQFTKKEITSNVTIAQWIEWEDLWYIKKNR